MSPAPRRLVELVESVRSHLRARALLALAAWCGVGVAVALLGAWLLAGGDGWAPGSDVPILLDVAVVLWLIAAVLAYRESTRQWLDEPPLADAIERVAGLDAGVVRGSLELARAVPAGVSSALAGRAAASALGDLNRPAPELAGWLGARLTGWVRRGSGALVALTVLLVALAVASPARTLGAWSGLSSPIRTMIDPVLPPVVLMPGSVEVLRGTDLRVDVEAPGRTTVQLHWQAAGDIARTRELVLVGGRGGHVLRDVSASLEYRALAPDGAETPRFRVTPIDPLFVSDLVVTAQYPAHTGLPPDEFRGEPPPLRLPEGTLLRFEGRASRPLSSAELLDSAGARAVALRADGLGFQGAWRPRVDGVFDWSFLDDSGAPAEIQPEPLRLALIPDSAPAISIPLPGRDTIMPINLRQPLILEARDDYGLGRLELVAYRVTAFGERMEPVVQGLDLGGTRAALARPLLDLTGWSLLPGDTVRYYATVTDNAPEEHTSTTREFVLRMPAAGEMQREAEERLDEVARRLEELAREAAQEAEENRNQARESAAREDARNQQAAREQGEMGFEERERLESAAEDQTELGSEVDSLRAELEALQKAMEDAGQADPQLAEDLRELQELLEQIAGDELSQRLDELNEALQRDDLERANEALGDLAQQQEDFRDRLEESLERFRRAAVEQDFRATTSEAEELARQERALAAALEEGDQPELRAEQQEQLAERADELSARMEQLTERLRQIEEADAAEGVEQASQEANRSRTDMQQASESARQGDQQAAAERAEEAAEAMEEAAQQLDQAQQQMAQQQAEAMQQALHQTADDALALARRQTELRERMRGASQEQTAGMRSDEAGLLQGVRNLADNLQSATEGSMAGGQELSAQVGRTMEAMQRTIDAMESRRGSTPSPYAAAEQVVGDLNQLALMAAATAAMMGQQGQGQGGDQVSEQLEQLAQQQGEVNNQTSQLMPLQLGQQAMSQQLQQMAQGQESIASDLGELSEQPGAQEETLGDLEQLAREAELLAQELAQGRLTPEMARRQERLFHRLLDAGRSLEREEFSDERESEVPEGFERADVLQLTPGQLGVLRYEIPDAVQLRQLSPAHRQLVIEYFERLNREPPRPPGTGGGA